MTVQEFLERYRKVEGSQDTVMFLAVRPRIVCKTGFSLSVKAGYFLYCTPRDNDGPYTHVEVGYISRPTDLLQKYAEDSASPRDTIYPYVPIEIVERVVANHGGIDTTRTEAGIDKERNHWEQHRWNDGGKE